VPKSSIDIDLDSQVSDELKNPIVKRKRTHFIQSLIGLAILALAVVGVVFISINSYNYIQKRINGDENLDAFNEFLKPVVMQDPKPFESVDKADNEFLLKAAIWKTLLDEEKAATYESDDDGRRILPVEDIEKNAESLFGKINLLFESIGDDEDLIEYNKDTGTYHIPLFSLDAFVPYTFSAKKRGDIYTLKVGYVADDENWVGGANGEKSEPTPSKTMKYVLKQTKSEYNIVSISLWEDKE